MPPRKKSPVPHLISTEELAAYEGLSLRLKGETIHICWRDPLNPSHKPSHRAGTLRSKPQEIREALDVVFRQRFLGGPVPKARANVPLSLLWDEWHPTTQLRANTIACYTSVWRHHLAALGDRNAATLSADLANAWLDREETTGRLSPALRTKAANVLRHLLRYGYKAGYLARNAGPGIVGGKTEPPTKTDTYLELDDAKRLIDAVRDTQPYYVPHMYMLLYTGLRIGELAGLRWGDIDYMTPGQGTLTVRYTYNDGRLGKLKTRAAHRNIPLTEAVRQEVLAYWQWQYLFHDPHPQGLAFTTKTGCGLNDDTFRARVFRPAVVACGFAEEMKISPHTLRHTFLTHLADMGTPVHVIMDLAGHTDYRMTIARYLGATPKARSLARVNIEDALTGMVPPTSSIQGPRGGYSHGNGPGRQPSRMAL